MDGEHDQKHIDNLVVDINVAEIAQFQPNAFIYRTYLTITQIQTIKIHYSKELHQQVTTVFPELKSKTVQNILDQRRLSFNRLILSGNLIA